MNTSFNLLLRHQSTTKTHATHVKTQMDCSVPHKTALTHMRLVWPTWDCSVPHDTDLSHMRLICATWDYSVPHGTALSLMKLLCPTWNCFVPHETALSNIRYILICTFCKTQKYLYFHPFFTFSGLICPYRDRNWTGLGQHWAISRTGTIAGLKFWGTVKKY